MHRMNSSSLLLWWDGGRMTCGSWATITHLACNLSNRLHKAFHVVFTLLWFHFFWGSFKILQVSFCGGKINFRKGFNGYGFPSLFGEMLTKSDIWSECCSGEIWFVTNRLFPHFTFTKLFDCIAVDVLTFFDNIYAYSTAIKKSSALT